MNVDPNLHFDPSSASKQLLDKYCTSFAGTSVSASALATVAALLSLSTAGDHPPTPASHSSASLTNESTISNASSNATPAAALVVGGAAASSPNIAVGLHPTPIVAAPPSSVIGSNTTPSSASISGSKGSEPAPRTPPTLQERFHVFLCNGYEDASGSDASSSSRSHTTDSQASSSRRSVPTPITTLPESWLNLPVTTSPSGRANHSSCVFTFHYCVKSCGPSGSFAVYEAKIIPVSSNILLASAPLYVTQSRLTDITTFQAPTIGVFVRESSSHRRRQLSTTPYTPESIELYAEVIAELLRNSPFMAAVSPRTPPSSKASTHRGDSTNSNTPEHLFTRPNGASSSSSLGSARGAAPHRFGDADLRPRRGSHTANTSSVAAGTENATHSSHRGSLGPAADGGRADRSSWDV